MLFTGWEVRIGNVPEVLSTALGHGGATGGPRAVLIQRAQFLPIRTDLGQWITFLFFSFWDLKVKENCTSASNLGVLK